MPSAHCSELLQFWGKTDKSEHYTRQEHEYHPLAYHLLDVAACADAILDANPARLRFLADLCEIEPEKLRRTLVCLIALHDLGKCARVPRQGARIMAIRAGTKARTEKVYSGSTRCSRLVAV
jgi:hypothetical protein